ncbi:hypothetical protein SLA2020_484340 [Shorea laevis]
MISWLPFMVMTVPPVLAACRFSLSRKYRILISSPPRSSTSPTWTTVADPPIHSPEPSIRSASLSASLDFSRSPWRSPTAIRRPSGPGSGSAMAAEKVGNRQGQFRNSKG